MYKLKAQGESGVLEALKEFHMCEQFFVKIQEECKGQGLHKKILGSHKDKETNENELFYQSSCFGNLLTMLYLIDNKYEEEKAKSVNDKVIKYFPHSLLAEYLKVHILIKSKKVTEAQKVIEHMNKNSNEKLESIKVKADYAYALVQLPPRFYSQGIQLYEEALEELTTEIGDELLENIMQPQFKLCVEIHKIIWSYFLIQTFNRLMNTGIIASQICKIIITPKLCFEKICKYIPNILCSTCVDCTYHARAYIELHDSLKKVSHRNKDLLKYLPDTCEVTRDPESWLQKAYNLAPDDGHVMERLGRHYRTLANNFIDFETAAEFLQRCVQKYPTRHVALHHLALCYRSMWIDKNKFSEAELHDNPVRSGQEPKRYGNKKKKRASKKRDPPKGYRGRDDQAKYHKKYSSFQDTVYQKDGSDLSESEIGDVAASVDAVENDANTELTDEGFDSDDNDKVVHGEQRLETQISISESCKPKKEFSNIELKALLPTTKQKTFPPNKQPKFGDMPQTYSKPDYYDKFRTSNPVDQGDYTEYLLYAIKTLECANEVVNGTSATYLIDLGRLYRSYNDIDKGMKYLGEAQSCTGATDHNKAIACEQYALCLHDKYCNRNKCTDKIELHDVIYIYRQAVIYSVRAREKSRIAFYNLKDLLKQQIEQHQGDDENMAMYKEELALLNLWVENLHTAKSFLCDALQKDVLHFQWELVLSFKRHGDNMSAYQYMKPLLVPEKVKEYIAFCEKIKLGKDGTPYPRPLDTPVPLEECLEIYMSVAIANVLNSGQNTEADFKNKKTSLCNIYKEAYNNLWDCQGAIVSDKPTPCKSVDVLILSEEESLEMQKMKELLESYCELSTYSEETIRAGQYPVREIELNAKKAKAFIFLVDEIFDTDDQTGRQWLTAKNLINDKNLAYIPKIYVSFKAGGTDKQDIPSITLDDASLKSDNDKHKVVQELYKKLFFEYPKKIKE